MRSDVLFANFRAFAAFKSLIFYVLNAVGRSLALNGRFDNSFFLYFFLFYYDRCDAVEGKVEEKMLQSKKINK